MKLLLTAGGTEEPLDGVRYLSNRSSGKTGLALTRLFAERGVEVLLLHAERMPVSGLPVHTQAFRSFDDLEGLLERALRDQPFDAVIHLAAVSDYRLASIEVDGRSVAPAARGKIGSGHELLLRLQPNPKLIDRIRAWSQNPGVTVVGFKLTDDPDPAVRQHQVEALLDRGVADLVVHNDIREIDNHHHLAEIHSRRGLLARTRDKNELAAALYGLLDQGESR